LRVEERVALGREFRGIVGRCELRSKAGSLSQNRE